jgi:hypothetical protein
VKEAKKTERRGKSWSLLPKFLYTVVLAQPNKWLGEGLHFVKCTIDRSTITLSDFLQPPLLWDPPLVLVTTNKKINSFLLALLVASCTTGKIFPAR